MSLWCWTQHDRSLGVSVPLITSVLTVRRHCVARRASCTPTFILTCVSVYKRAPLFVCVVYQSFTSCLLCLLCTYTDVSTLWVVHVSYV